MTSKELARIVREDVVTMAYLSKGSHVGSALSLIDILAVLYTDIINVKPEIVNDINRDRFILSKGHGGSAIYAILARKGFFDPEKLKDHYKDGSDLSGHVSHKNLPGIEISTGSLGHGVSIAAGFALSSKIAKRDNKVFVVVGDGECNEGCFWETLLFAAQYKLDNLTIVIDKNKIQAMGNCSDVMNTESLYKKIENFGFLTLEVDGHSHEDLKSAFSKFEKDKPKCIIADTIKGYGVSFMKNNLLWHYRNPNEEEYKVAIKEIRGENNA